MKLTHVTNTALGTTTTNMVARPLAIVNYLNSRIDEICPESQKTESIARTGNLRSTIPTIFGEAIVIHGRPKDVLPVLSWLNEASSVYMSYIGTIDELKSID